LAIKVADDQGTPFMNEASPLQLLEEAFQRYQRGDLEAAEAILGQMPSHPSALHLLGVLRVRQGRLEEAADSLAQSVAIQPHEAQAQFNFGKVLNALGRWPEAADALRAALNLDPTIVEALFVLGQSLHAQGRGTEAVDAYRRFLVARPGHVTAKIALSMALIETGQLQSAERLLTASLSETTDPNLLADMHQTLASILGKSQPARALEHLELAQNFAPGRAGLESDRAMLLEELQRFHDAKAAYEQILARDVINAKAHHCYNELIWRLGDNEQFLSSYDHAPRTQELMLAKAAFLQKVGRFEEAEHCYRSAIERYSYCKEAALGIGLALVGREQFREAISVLEQAAQCYPDSADVYCNLAGALAQSGDPGKANEVAQRALGVEPENQIALALLGTSWRLMEDERDEVLNGYDNFVQAFDLEPPAGYSDMRSFNAELLDYVKPMHPPVREYLRQSLRGGTQTRDDLFGAGHLLVEKLQIRIREAVGRYIAALEIDEHHPFLSRKQNSFRFTGSWSSCLRDGGFHINHLHPGGWISSCYYIDLPEVVKDETGRQGWIKFGEPSFEVGLPVRRAIQPAVGRLVLFPSYMWHGTMPFHDNHARTTIAFDILPGMGN
jgi:tetratricopeptide (TPR) repeat protein